MVFQLYPLLMYSFPDIKKTELQTREGITMSIYDVLNTPKLNADCNFTANNAVIEINILKGPALIIPFANGNGKANFQDGDNVALKKVRTILPFQYGRGNYEFTDYKIQLNWAQGGGVVNIPELGNYGGIMLNSVCGELQPEVFLNAPSVGSGNFGLNVNAFDVSISQINAPAVLNTDIMYFGFQLEVIHTLPMV
jgi:hypothetical protein